MTAKGVDEPSRAVSSPKVRCKATKRDGDRCGNWAVVGLKVCRMHGGSLKNKAVRAKRERAIVEQRAARLGRELLVEASERWTGALHGRAGIERSPVEHLLDELHISANVVAVLSQVVAGADSIDDTLPTAAGGMSRAASVEYQAWERERDRHAKLAKTLLDAGVAERQVQVLEGQAQQMAAALGRILQRLGVSDHPDAPRVVREEMLTLSPGT